MLGVGGLETALNVADGREAVLAVIEAATPLLNTSPLGDPIMFVDDVPLTVSNDYLSLGSKSVLVADLRECVSARASLPIGDWVRKAALCLFAVATHKLHRARCIGSDPVPLPADAGSRYVGVHVRRRVDHVNREGQQVVVALPEVPIESLAYAGDDCFVDRIGEELQSRDFVDGRAGGLACRADGTTLIARRATLPAPSVPVSMSRKFVGDYDVDRRSFSILADGEQAFALFEEVRLPLEVRDERTLAVVGLPITLKLGDGRSLVITYQGEAVTATRR